MSNPEIPFLIYGKIGGDDDEQQATQVRQPVEAAEGVVGQTVENVAVTKAVSLTEIKVLDLIAEGEISGLVTTDYQLAGTKGDLGYSSLITTEYPEKSVNDVNVNFLRSVYWNEVPVLSAENLFNFQQVNVQHTRGLAHGPSSAEAAFGAIVDELTVSAPKGERLRGPNTAGNVVDLDNATDTYSKTYRILNSNCKAIVVNIKVTQLSETITTGDRAGDVVEAAVNYSIRYKPLFNTALITNTEDLTIVRAASFIEVAESINGKISYGYIKSTRINFPLNFLTIKGFLGWEVKIVRTTPDSVRNTLRNQTFIDSITEVYGESFAYPNSAIVAQEFSSEFFTQIPNRAFDVRLLKVKIPNNYNPIKKTYDGDWDGIFKETKEWTDNPAWCFYDILTNKRYGLGKYITTEFVDKWTLYEISKYCDILVDDGFGGVEPRFTCNVLINSREEAYKVINDMASIFRSIVYYSAGSIYTSQDCQKPPVFTFNNANVENGDFNYSTSSKRVRHTVAVIRYNDKSNFYKPAIEYVEDAEGLKTFGVRELEVTAFGCTSRGQALRLGRWALISEQLETEAITFSIGMEGIYMRPGDVFRVFDKNRHKVRSAGRIYQVFIDQPDKKELLLDDLIDFVPGVNYHLSLMAGTHTYDSSQVTDLTSQDAAGLRNPFIQNLYFDTTQVTNYNGKSLITWPNGVIDFETFFIRAGMAYAIQTTDNGSGDPQLQNQFDHYRAIRIEEKEAHRYTIAGIQYDEDKYESIEQGLNFDSVDFSVPPPAPDGLDLKVEAINETSKLKWIRYEVLTSEAKRDGVSSYLIYAKLGAWAPGDFAERTPANTPPVIKSETPDSKYLIEIIKVESNLDGEIELFGYHYPLINGEYYFRAYARNVGGLPSTSAASNNIAIENENPIQALRISSLRMSNQTADPEFASHSTGLYTVPNPVFKWTAGFEETPERFSTSNLFYRLSFRKPTYSGAPQLPITNAAIQGTEAPDPWDTFNPSYIIYNQIVDYSPKAVGELDYKFDLDDNLAAFTKWQVEHNVVESGVLREYDVVVEAHLEDGTSSAGGNFKTSNRGGITDSLYSNPYGYDILCVNNPKVHGIVLTSGDYVQTDTDTTAMSQCVTTHNGSGVCTDQYISSDGEITIFTKKGALPPDTAGAFIFSCSFPFTPEEAKIGKRSSDGKDINRFEATSITNPITASSNLIGLETGFVMVAAYDSYDVAFRKAMRSRPLHSEYVGIWSGLNYGNCCEIIERGIREFSPAFYRNWVRVKVIFPNIVESNESSTDFPIDFKNASYSWYGYGIENVECMGETLVEVPYFGAQPASNTGPSIVSRTRIQKWPAMRFKVHFQTKKFIPGKTTVGDVGTTKYLPGPGYFCNTNSPQDGRYCFPPNGALKSPTLPGNAGTSAFHDVLALGFPGCLVHEKNDKNLVVVIPKAYTIEESISNHTPTKDTTREFFVGTMSYAENDFSDPIYYDPDRPNP